MERRWQTGETVVLREVYRGVIWTARPAIVVEDRFDYRSFFVPPRNRYRSPIGPAGEPLRLPTSDWSLIDAGSSAKRILSFAFPDTPYAVLLSWDEATDAFAGWYVNLQAALRPTSMGFDTVDHVLDVVIEPDRLDWRWKDEDELTEAVGLGLFTPEDAGWSRWWGERAVEHVLLRQPPFDLAWEGWRPDPAWPAPALPPGWDLEPPA
jgi:predicted RNA-binding protein associated with RNAse of E/G family